MKQRPLGVTILSILFLVGGVAMLLIQFIGRTEIGSIFSELEISPIVTFLLFCLIAILYIVASIGMWSGKKWGWWTCTLSYCFSIFRNIYSIIMIFVLSNQLNGNAVDLSEYFFKYLFRILFSIVFLSYFYEKRIMEYFDLKNVSKFKATVKIIGVSIILMVFKEIVTLL